MFEKKSNSKLMKKKYWQLIIFSYSLIARLGEYDLESDPDCDGPDNCNPKVVNAQIAEIKIHFQFRNKQNDIALLKLQNALPEDYYDYFLPICLPQSAELEENLFIERNVTVVGWGSIGNGNCFI